MKKLFTVKSWADDTTHEVWAETAWNARMQLATDKSIDLNVLEVLDTAQPVCTKCNGTGSKSYASAHPQCSDCYGTGIKGMTITRLEAAK